jgi:mxaA protein
VLRAVVLLWLPLLAQAQANSVTIKEPRAYGHVIGDVLTREVQVRLPAGRSLNTEALPKPGRVDTWLELRAVQVDRAQASQQTLRLHYQVVNVGAAVVTTTLPAVRLALLGGAGVGAAGESVELSDWPVHLSPLTPRFAVARAGLEPVQPDIAPQRTDLQPMAVRLAAYAALALMLAWPALARRWPQLAPWRRRAPFHAAWRDLRALKHLPGDPAQRQAQRQAFARLHAAFNASAGQAVFAPNLEALYQSRPALRQAAPHIDAFFAHSQQLFFANAPSTWPLEDLRALALTLARLEAKAP